ncbi:MAG: hypothetical protein IJ613_00160, partial [Muribaculaceae bacterium]|nr:hypothetical protein [Muribaculaceae bacterium]
GYTYGWSQGEKTHKVDHGGKKKEQKADFVRFYRCDYRKSGTFSVASACRVISLPGMGKAK